MLGYSGGRADSLHPICAARLAHAAGLDADVVVLSGTPRETALMREAWPAPAAELDPAARRTADSAVNASRFAETAGADEVLVVTSWWHRPRAQLLFRLAVGRRGAQVIASPARGPWSLRHLLREAACFPLVPFHLAFARTRSTGTP